MFMSMSMFMSTTSSHRTLLAAALAGLLACGTGPAPVEPAEKTKEQAKKGTVPFEMLATNHMVVRAKINGKGPFDLIFDVERRSPC